MDRSLPVADCLEDGVEVGGGHGDELLAVGLLQELVLLARGLPQLRADVHQQVHVGNDLEKVLLLGGAVHSLVGPLVIDGDGVPRTEGLWVDVVQVALHWTNQR